MVLVVTPSKRATPCWRCTTKLPASRSSKKPSAARARGRARRCGTRRPVTSVSESTATLASGRMNPLVIGAATTQAPAVPGAASTTGACTPSAARAADSRAAPAAVAAHRVTEYPWPTSPVTPAARRAGSPATGSKRRTVSAAMSGPSGTGGRAVTPAALSLSRRSKGTCRRGKLSSSPSFAPQVAASVSASAASSSSSWTPRSRNAARLDQHDLRSRRQQVGQDPRRVVEEREPRLHAVELRALGQVLPHRRAPGPARHQRRRRQRAAPG